MRTSESRVRGVILMAISNATGAIVLTTGNKSEMATGYSTLYGDSAGGFGVIKDVSKTLVYELCAYRNARAEAEGDVPPIPAAVIEKPPSAELRPDQRDDQSLPSYDELDPVLQGFVEFDQTAPELLAAGFNADVVARVAALVEWGRVQTTSNASWSANSCEGLWQRPPNADYESLSTRPWLNEPLGKRPSLSWQPQSFVAATRGWRPRLL